MGRGLRMLAAVLALLSWPGAPAALAQKSGGVLRFSHFDNPASMSILEESTNAAERPMMGVFNNLVLYDQHVAQNSLGSIVPDLATSWSWSEDGAELTFELRQGVKWHDGQPFTAADVKCTWDLLTDKGADKLRINPRKSWYSNLAEVTANGDYEATFHLKRPQPAFIALLASGWSPVYPCHVSAAAMRRHPIGTGPFKFVEFTPNESIRVTRNPDYWKQGRPYLDGIDYVVMKDTSTRNLAFFAGKVDVTSSYGVSIPNLKDFKTQAPQAICAVTMANVSRNLLVNRSKPPFDNPELRRAMALSLDRKAFIDIITEGQGAIGGAMLPPPEGVWGMPPDVLKTLPGYDPDVQKNRAEARSIMEKLGYGPDKRLAIKVSSRNIPAYRDPAVILIDQLKRDLHRRRARSRRHGAMVSQGHAQGLHGRPQRHRKRRRRPRPAILRKLRLRRRAQLQRLLQPRGRQAGRRAVAPGRPGKTQATGLADRAQAGRGRGPSDHLLPAWRHLLAAAGQGADDDGQQHLQRLAFRRRLARQIAPPRRSVERRPRRCRDTRSITQTRSTAPRKAC